jgi:hypothetical protein
MHQTGSEDRGQSGRSVFLYNDKRKKKKEKTVSTTTN